MPHWFQNLLVLAAVGGASLFLAKQAWNALTGQRSRIGSCCAKGCSAHLAKPPAARQAVVFIPVEMLRRSK